MSSSELVREAYSLLYGKQPSFECEVSYGRLRGFNASIRKRGSFVVVSFSRKWMDISRDIQLGVVQYLFNRLFKTKERSVFIDLYHNFIRGVHIAVPKTKSHPVLVDSFNRVNGSFFFGSVECPNLVLGRGVSRLGSYDYGADTISISRILLDDLELLDYVMYHEVLHKVHKYRSGVVRSSHHTRQFRVAERAFPDSQELERRLSSLVSKSRRRSWSPFFA